MPSVSPDSPARPPRGRPRSEQARRAILTAAQDLLRDEGFAAVSIDSVAKRSGVARTTIYRWWPSIGALLIDVLEDLAAVAVPPQAGDDPLRAIRLEMRRTAAAMSGLTGRLFLALLGEVHRDPRIRSVLLERIVYPRREATARAIRDAQARGLLRDDMHPYLIRDLFFGPIFYRVVMGHEPATERFATQTFERVITGLTPNGENTKRKK